MTKGCRHCYWTGYYYVPTYESRGATLVRMLHHCMTRPR